MTVKELYEKCKAIMFEKQTSKIYDNYVIEIVNSKLAELKDENNFMRMFYGLKPLENVPQVENLSDELGVIDNTNYETIGDGLGIMPEIQLFVLPMGVVAEFLMDDDLQKKSIFDAKYNNARVQFQKFVSKDKIEELEAK